ncbi:MAG: carboxypeptidase regulatory-like domain-containing protein, partial [Patescibacteria group bacterium]
GNGSSLTPVPAGSLTLAFPTDPNTQKCEYQALAEGPGGSSRLSAVTITRQASPTGTISASATEVEAGTPVTVKWSSQNYKSAEVTVDKPNPRTVSREPAGQVTEPIAETTSYTLTVTGDGNKVFTESVTIKVKGEKVKGELAVPEVTLSVSKTELKPGESVELTWASKNAKTLELTASSDPGFKQTALSGTANHSPKETTIYTASATGGGRTVATSVVVTVTLPGGGGGDISKFEVFFAHTPASADPTKLKDSITVTLAATKPNATIYYTSDPTVSNEDLANRRRVSQYTQPITLNETTVVRAIGFLEKASSSIASARYVFQKDGPSNPGLNERLRIIITPDPKGRVFTEPTEFTLEVEELEGLIGGGKSKKRSPESVSLHVEPGRKKLTRNSPKIGTKFLVSTAGEWTFKAFGSESPDTTVFFDVRPGLAGGGGPPVSVNPPPGSYTGPIQVTLAASGGASPVSLLYTTDGSNPLGAGAKSYTGALTITQSTLLRYAAKDAQGKTSEVSAAAYTITQAAGGAPPTPTLTLTWPTIPPTKPDQPVRYDINCNGERLTTVDEPLATQPTSAEPCTYTVVAKSGDEVAATVTPVVAAPVAKAKSSSRAPATPAAVATAAAQTTVATAAVTAAAVATVATASVPLAAAATGALYQLLAHGFGVVVLLGRRRKGPFSEVLDRTTGLPIAGATVTLIEASSTRAVAVVTSDTLGRFSMLVDQPGRYLVRVSHPSYATWHSRELTVGQSEQALEFPNITLQAGQPSTGLDLAEARSQFILTGLAKLRFPLLIAGTLILLATSVRAAGGRTFTPDRSLSIAVYVALWASEVWVRTRPRPYGMVMDGATGQPIDRAIVRLLDGQTGRLIKTVVTGAKGRFQFLAPKGNCSLVVVHAGYEPYRQDHLLLAGKDSLVNETVRLRPLTEGASPINPPAPQLPLASPPQPPVHPIVPPQLPRRGPPPPNP